MSLTHLNEKGDAHMVDVGDKPVTEREATASGYLALAPATLTLLQDDRLPKGDVLATARIAGIQAAKRCHELIPLCHALPLSGVTVTLGIDRAASRVNVSARCRVKGRTGVEMEALTAVSVACLTLYDMCKAVDRSMVIGDIQVDDKQGGRSGHYQREAAPIVTGESAAGEIGLRDRLEAPSVNVKFLAELRERLGVSDLVIGLDDLAPSNIAGLKQALMARDPVFQVLSERRVLCAVNQVMVSDKARVTSDDEVAFFPPVTGG